jgi:undecaprenyl-diphosphatase
MRTGASTHVVIGVLAVATALLSIVAAGGGTLPGDVAIARAVQRLDSGLASDIATVGNAVGSTRGMVPVAAALVVALILLRCFPEALFLMIAISARRLGPELKRLFESPRPTRADVRVVEIASGYGFPSGHAFGTTLLYSSMIVLANAVIGSVWLRRLVQAICVAVMLLVGFSRVYTGAHWPSDVLGGYLWGALVVGLLVPLANAFRQRRAVPADRR